MSLDAINGFIPKKIQSLELSSDDCKKYGIKPEDFREYDTNGDFLIDANEFLSGGMRNLSIFNAFKILAKPEGGYVEDKDAVNNNQSQNQLASNNPNKQNTTNPLMHAEPNQSHKLFYSA